MTPEEAKKLGIKDTKYSLANEGENEYNMPKQKNTGTVRKRVYSKITRNITNQEHAQVYSEVMQFRKEQGTHFIDLSKLGYKSYIYERNGNDVNIIARVSSSDEFTNFVRREVENGEFGYSQGFNNAVEVIKSKYRNNSVDNASLRGEREYSTNDKLFDRLEGGEQNTNGRTFIEKSGTDDGRLIQSKELDNSSFSMGNIIKN